MKMKLKKLILENFMMYATATFDFFDITKIMGKNGKGKSSIVNAYTWLMFNCSYDLSDNPAIRRKVDGKTVDDMDVSVTAVFDMDGKEVTAKKVQKRTYGKDGITYKDDNKYYINGVPKTMKDFNEYFEVDMSVFKMCSNVNAFLSKKPAEMREFLFGTVEDVTDLSIAQNTAELAELVPLLEKNTKEELEAMNKATKAKVTKDLPVMDGQIKEKERDIQMKSDMDLSALELHRNVLKEQIAENVAKQTDNEKQYEEYQKLSDGILELKLELSGLQQKANLDLEKKRAEIRGEISTVDNQKREVARQISLNKQDIQRADDAIKRNEAERIKQADLWKAAKERVFDEDSFTCPYCGQEYPMEKKEQLRAEFEAHKTEELKQITDKGMELKAAIENDKEELEQMQATLKKNEDNEITLLESIKGLEAAYAEIPQSVDITDMDQYKEIQKQIAEKESAMQSENSVSEIKKQLKAEEEQLRQQLQAVESEIAKSNTEADEQRLDELRKQRMDLEQSKADAEKILDLLNELDKAKNNALSDAINSRFGMVKWQLWELAKNGGYKNVCIPTVDGMSLLDISANKAKKVLGKLDICNSIQKITGNCLPVFLDDCESLDGDNIKKSMEIAESQLILLQVTDDEKLKVEGL